jgi:hypothetical protein
VNGETQIIEDGKAHDVYLDPEMATAQEPQGQEVHRDRAEKLVRR